VRATRETISSFAQVVSRRWFGVSVLSRVMESWGSVPRA
jgi:hypothetical protein